MELGKVTRQAGGAAQVRKLKVSFVFLIGGKCGDGKSDFAMGPWPGVGILAPDRV